MRLARTICAAAMLVASAVAATPAAAQFYQCVTYAREATGVSIRGNANTWWGQADGRYARGQTPKPGAIMAFKAMRGMPMGHVAVVAQVLDSREVLLDHANWSRRGKVEHGVRAVDVSPAGDWSEVRVWYGRSGDLGLRANAVAGFIYPNAVTAPVQTTPSSVDRGTLVAADIVEMAKLGG